MDLAEEPNPWLHEQWGVVSVRKEERVRGCCVMWMKRERGASSKRYRGFWTASHGHKMMGPRRDTLDERKMISSAG
jgi:hypothetical protein